MTAKHLTIPKAAQAITNSARLDLGINFLDEHCANTQFLSFAEIIERSTRYARALQKAGLGRDSKALLLLPNRPEFLLSFFGLLHIGAVPVPLALPHSLRNIDLYAAQLEHIAKTCSAKAIITLADYKAHFDAILGKSPLRVVFCEELNEEHLDTALVDSSPDDLALIQFTSGSTSRPRGAAISHRSLLTNFRGVYDHKLPLQPNDVIVSWLPFFHDMGLAQVISPIVFGVPAHMMHPQTFVKHPITWLKVMSRVNGTISFAPNFAYNLCIKRVKDAALSEINLGSWRLAACGAEPVNFQTMQEFAKKFSSAGFNSSALSPCYGLAESTVGVTFNPANSGVRHFDVDLNTLAAENRAVAPNVPDSQSIRLVCCGSALPDHEIAIADEDGNRLANAQVGEILIKGDSLMQGYYNDEKATAETLQDGWLHTGDLGFLINDELYICGRKKELVIVAGRNYYPADIEWAAAQVEGIRAGNVIAFSIGEFTNSEEQLVVLAESKLDKGAYQQQAKEVSANILTALGIKAAEVILLPPQSLPKTTSGKLQRSLAKKNYLKRTT